MSGDWDNCKPPSPGPGVVRSRDAPSIGSTSRDWVDNSALAALLTYVRRPHSSLVSLVISSATLAQIVEASQLVPISQKPLAIPIIEPPQLRTQYPTTASDDLRSSQTAQCNHCVAALGKQCHRMKSKFSSIPPPSAQASIMVLIPGNQGPEGCFRCFGTHVRSVLSRQPETGHHCRRRSHWR